MSDEQRQLVKASIAGALLGSAAGLLTFGIIYMVGGLSSGPGFGRGPGRLIMLCAGLAGFMVPRVTERITGVCGPIMWVPVIAGGLAGSLTLQLTLVSFGVSLAAVLFVACIVYVVAAGVSIVMASA